MKIVVSSEGRGLDGEVSAHFGRCPEFVLLECEGKAIVSAKQVSNPFFGNHEPGAVPRFISSLKPDILITGAIGPMALELFDSFGIRVIPGVRGKTRDAITDFLNGKLKAGENRCNH